MDGHGSINFQKHITFGQRNTMVNVLLLLHVGIAHLIESPTYIKLIVSRKKRKFLFFGHKSRWP